MSSARGDSTFGVGVYQRYEHIQPWIERSEIREFRNIRSDDGATREDLARHVVCPLKFLERALQTCASLPHIFYAQGASAPIVEPRMVV